MNYNTIFHRLLVLRLHCKNLDCRTLHIRYQQLKILFVGFNSKVLVPIVKLNDQKNLRG